MDNQSKTVKCTESVMKKCKYSYRYNSSSNTYCDYMTKVGHRRGCSPEACDKFEKRKVAIK